VRRTATGNLLISIAVLVVTHLAAPLTQFVYAMIVGGIITVNLQTAVQNPTFTPLHLYFMSTAGSDANDGLAPTSGGGHGPWASPNHALVCGDVIVAATGDYSAVNMGLWGTVSSCPSASGGIDGAGGIYFATLLCGGADLEACTTSGVLWNMPKNNWSVQGWKVTFPACASIGCGSEGRGFNVDGCSGNVHHFAYINNVVYNVASAVHTDDCGLTGSFGADYVAVVGNIGVRANYNSSFPEATFDIVGPFPLDTNVGTHAYLYNNYAWNNDGCGVNCVIDAEAFMFDAWNFHPGYNNTGVIANNIAWKTQRYCTHIFGNGANTITPTIKVYSNTCFSNNGNILTDNAAGELNIATGLPWAILLYNNIARQPNATSGSSRPVFAFDSQGGAQSPAGTNSGLVIGGTGKDNVMSAVATNCPGNCNGINGTGASPWGSVSFDANAVPTVIFSDPGFNNTTDLLTNRSSNTPNCSGFVNTTLCMGWNANMRVLTNPSVIYDLQPDRNCGSVANQCVGKGFQLPSTTCAGSGDVFTDYPMWLKGIVYLHWDGTKITQNADLATRKCGL